MGENVSLVLNSIKSLTLQAKQAWEEAGKIDIPDEYKKATNVVVCGMGGSILPTYALQAALETTVPVTVVSDYRLPPWTSDTTLVFLASYSGNTDEVLACAEQAGDLGCLISGITSGGKLGDFLESNEYPAYIFNSPHNPSQLPRLGLGYMIFGQLGIFSQMGLIDDEDNKLSVEVTSAIEQASSLYSRLRDQAKEFAQKAQGKALIIFAARHLVGCAQIMAAQTNESAKTMASYFAIPAANHHLLEGLKHPALPESRVIFINSESYAPRIKQRMELTREVVKQNGYKTSAFLPTKASLLSEMFQTIIFSSRATLALASLLGEDPAETPWVDYFKEKLAKKG